MRTLAESNKSIVEIGKEFAFEGLEPEYFQGNSEEEYEAFNIGYQEGLRIMQERQAIVDQNIEKEELPSMKK